MIKYLSRTPNIFRTYIKHSSRALALTLNVVLYHDELIIRDPVFVLLNEFEEGKGSIESLKKNIRRQLQSLNSFRNPIEDGFILLECVSRNIELNPPGFAKEIANNKDVFNALTEAAYFGHAERPDSVGNPNHIVLGSRQYKFHVLHNEFWKKIPEGTKQVYGATMDLQEIFPRKSCWRKSNYRTNKKPLIHGGCAYS